MAVKTADSPLRVPPQGKMTFEEFLEWCDEDTWAEWVDGEVQVVSPASDKHQDIADFLPMSSAAFSCPLIPSLRIE